MNQAIAEASKSAGARVPVNISLLLALANEKVGRGVDADMVGNRITDCDVILRGAYRPAVMRLVNMAADRHTQPITRQQMLKLAEEAFALETDLDLKGNVITEYKVVVSEPYGFGPTVLNLVNLAIEHQAILRKQEQHTRY
jgi:hypothetical protein